MAGGVWTVSVKLWVACGPTPLGGVNVSAYVPAVPPAGVPARVPVPLPLLTKLTPEGKAPVTETVEFGKPLVVTVKVPALPVVKVVLLALVIAGAWFTVSVKLCVALLPTPLDAVKVSGYVPPVPAPGVPASTPVAGVHLQPVGNAAGADSVGAGVPVAVTVKVPALPTLNGVALAPGEPRAAVTGVGKPR